MRKKIQKVLKIIGMIERVLLSGIFVFMFAIMVMQIVSRYIFNSPIIWTDEMTTLLQVTLGFLGIGYGIRKKSHVCLSGFYDKMPGRVQHMVSILTDILVIVCLVFIIEQGFFYTKMMWNIKTMTTSFMNGYFYISVPIGLLEGALYLGFDMVDHIAYLLNKEPIFRLGEENE